MRSVISTSEVPPVATEACFILKSKVLPTTTCAGLADGTEF